MLPCHEDLIRTKRVTSLPGDLEQIAILTQHGGVEGVCSLILDYELAPFQTHGLSRSCEDLLDEHLMRCGASHVKRSVRREKCHVL